MLFVPAQLQKLAADIFTAAGCSAEEADCIAAHLVEANLMGHDSHGVIRIPSYIQWMNAGKVLPNKTVTTVFENEVISILDGEYGFGQSIGKQAMQIGIDKSSKHGVAVVGLRNVGHLGRIGAWADMAVQANKVSLHFVNTSGAGLLVAPFGGIERRLSANPFAAGIPIPGKDPVVLDMSACTIAEGKIRVALNKGVQVPEGCIIDAKGEPTTDPRVFYANPPGAILPIAGHKGFGLGMIIEFFAGALTAGSCTNPVNSQRLANGMLTILLDYSVFVSADCFAEEVRRYVDFVKSSATVPGVEEILMPGEIERKTRQRRSAGIELDETTWSQIHGVATTLNVQHKFAAPTGTGTSQAGLNIPALGEKK
ncbi:MAG: malate/lactate/ureidoglycolate dehydrogenase, partial [Planctomycetaceae bacterium]